MKYAYVRDNKIEKVFPSDLIPVAVWIECADDAKIGDFFDKNIAAKEDLKKSEFPSLEAKVDALIQAVGYGQSEQLNALVAQINLIEDKYK